MLSNFRFAGLFQFVAPKRNHPRSQPENSSVDVEIHMSMNIYWINNLTDRRIPYHTLHNYRSS